ncbi:MAG: TetR family transcriptional regulator, partial [Lutimaribacter sp.]
MARGLARDHDEKRAALRKGAARYFAAHGFDRASMTGAAKSCGVSKALMYHYWPSKEELLFDILDDHLGCLLDVVQGARGGGMRDLIAALLAAYADAGGVIERYPDANAVRIRQALADRYGLKVENILMGIGSDELLSALVRTYAGAGEEVL